MKLRVKMENTRNERKEIQKRRKKKGGSARDILTTTNKTKNKKKPKIDSEPQSMTKKIRFHTMGVTAIKEIKSTDGSNFLAVGSSNGQIALMDLGKPYMETANPERFITRRINAHEEGVRLIEFSPIFDVVFTAGVATQDSTSEVFVWDTVTVYGMKMDDKKRLASDSEAQIAAINVVDDDTEVITVDIYCNVNIYSMHTFARIQKLPPPSNFTGTVSGSACIPSRPSQKLPGMLAISSTRLHLYHRKVLDVFDPLITAFYNPWFQNFVTATANRVCIWDAFNGALIRVHESSRIYGPSGTSATKVDITSVTIDGTGRRLLVGDETGQVRVVNCMDGKTLKLIDPHGTSVTFLGYAPIEKCVVSTGADGTLHMADDVDIDGYQVAKNGRQARSVLMRTIVVDTTKNTIGDHHTAKLGGDSSNVEDAPPSVPHSRRGSRLLANETKTLATLRKGSLMLGGGGRRSSLSNSIFPNDGGGGGEPRTSSTVVAVSRRLSQRRSSLTQNKGGVGRRMSLFKDHALGKEEAQSFSELSCCTFSTHLNLMATGTTTGNGEHHLNIWDYEMCTLVGTCVHPYAKSGESFDVSALEFMCPKPFLVGSLSTGLVHVWEVPKAVCVVTLLPTCVEAGKGGRWVDEIFAKINKPTNIITSICLCEVVEGGDHIIFASDDKGFVFAWVITQDIVAGGPVTSRRRATFNPHRVVNPVVGGDELTHSRRLARSCQSKNLRTRTPSYFWRAHDEMISKIR